MAENRSKSGKSDEGLVVDVRFLHPFILSPNKHTDDTDFYGFSQILLFGLNHSSDNVCKRGRLL
jgi:hypothetical protein